MAALLGPAMAEASSLLEPTLVVRRSPTANAESALSGEDLVGVVPLLDSAAAASFLIRRRHRR